MTRVNGSISRVIVWPEVMHSSPAMLFELKTKDEPSDDSKR